MRRVIRVIEVGANDGYFTFGCAAALRRLKKHGRIVAFEPQQQAYNQLQRTQHTWRFPSDLGIEIDIDDRFVGSVESGTFISLDSLTCGTDSVRPEHSLIKIDVEGAECDVIDGAARWLNPTNLFLI